MTAIPVFLQAITLFKKLSSITEVKGCPSLPHGKLASDDDSSTKACKIKL